MFTNRVAPQTVPSHAKRGSGLISLPSVWLVYSFDFYHRQMNSSKAPIPVRVSCSRPVYIVFGLNFIRRKKKREKNRIFTLRSLSVFSYSMMTFATHTRGRRGHNWGGSSRSNRSTYSVCRGWFSACFFQSRYCFSDRERERLKSLLRPRNFLWIDCNPSNCAAMKSFTQLVNPRFNLRSLYLLLISCAWKRVVRPMLFIAVGQSSVSVVAFPQLSTYSSAVATILRWYQGSFWPSISLEDRNSWAAISPLKGRWCLRVALLLRSWATATKRSLPGETELL